MAKNRVTTEKSLSFKEQTKSTFVYNKSIPSVGVEILSVRGFAWLRGPMTTHHV